ncbi:MAG: hypothetical protein WDN08_04805 [Rhizomicrobium sp.]
MFRPAIVALAEKVARSLAPLHPDARTPTQLFAGVVRAVAAGNLPTIARYVEPALDGVPHPQHYPLVTLVGAGVLTALFEHALIEHGAEVEASLGEPSLVLTLDAERVLPGELVAAAMKDEAKAHAMLVWAERLESLAASKLLEVSDTPPALHTPAP